MYLYYKTKDFASPFETYLMLHASLVGLMITISTLHFVNWTRVLRKLDTGLIPGSSYLLFWPFFLSLHTHVAVKRYFSTEPRFTEVSDGLFVGAWPSRPTDIPPAGVLPPAAIIDCTCELPRMSCAMRSPYLCVRAWDSCAPTPGDIELAVRWAMLKRAEGVRVFIHCANGIVFFPSSPQDLPFQIMYTSQHITQTLFRFTTMFYGTNKIMQNIPQNIVSPTTMFYGTNKIMQNIPQNVVSPT